MLSVVEHNDAVLCGPEEISKSILNFLSKEVDDMIEYGSYALEVAEEENNFHMMIYWIDGIQTAAYGYIMEHFSKYGSLLCDEVISMYEGRVQKSSILESKIKTKFVSGNYKVFIACEALATLLLKEYQELSVFYTVYGCEEQDFVDLERAHHISRSIYNEEQFPIIKIEDVAGALVGASCYTQPSSLYDVYAHMSDNDRPGQTGGISEPKDETIQPVFTPDPFEYDGVVARWKRYGAIRRKGKGFNLLELQYKLDSIKSLAESAGLFNYADSLRELAVIEFITEEYLYRFSKPPLGLPINKDSLSIIKEHGEGRGCMRVIFKIRGICQGRNEWREVYNEVTDIPYSVQEIQDQVIRIAINIKEKLAGTEKKGSKAAKAGLYPRRLQASSGLNIGNIPLHVAEAQALYLIKKALRIGYNPVASCSFGKDSILVLHLLRRVTHNFKVLFNNTKVEFPQTISFMKRMKREWALDIVEARPEISFWDFLAENSFNFERKGDRRGGKTSISEICCYLLKHKPSKKAIQEYGWDIGFTGIRADESWTRTKSGKYNGPCYISVSWNQLLVTPIISFTDEMVTQYYKKYDVPLSELYNKILYDEEGNVLFIPRTGCWACLVAGKGYLRWLRTYFPKGYMHLMRDRGLAKTLYAMALNLDTKTSTKKASTKSKFKDQLSLFNQEEETIGDFSLDAVNIDWDSLELLIRSRPCFFENALKR